MTPENRVIYERRRLNIRTIEHLVFRIGVSESDLAQYAAGGRNLYLPPKFEKKKSGGIREINRPKFRLKQVQKKINRLLQEVKIPDTLYGSVKGRDYIENARQHVGQYCVARFDIKDFFPSVHFKRVLRLFLNLGCTPDVADLLANLTSYAHRLPQGAPTSPTIALLIYAEFEPRLKRLADIYGLKMGSQVDDVFFSGPFDVARIKSLICKIFRQEGFTIKREKIVIAYSSDRQEVAGLTVNARVNVTSDYKRALRALLYRCSKLGPDSQIPAGKSKEWLRSSLEGRIRHVERINPDLGRKFGEAFSKISWN